MALFVEAFNQRRRRHQFLYALMLMFWSGSRHKALGIKHVSTACCVRFVMHRSNPAFKLTQAGGADLWVVRVSSAPVRAA